uniref:ATP synthase subunit d, mitochondrial n=1 Tax=Ixodes scapularis TaxID=6945 RepID=Q4PM92_IXOSC|nr:ATP synthase D chain [Ixodes scapularis]
MAAKRIAKSAFNWAALAERVPEEQQHLYQAFKAKSDGYLRKVFSYPENPPPIDFAMYRSRLSNPALVDQFEKSYKSFTVPFPKEHLTPQIDAEERQAKDEVEGFIRESKERIEGFKQELLKFQAMIPAAHMTLEDYADYFPEHALNVDKPTYWPHDGVFEEYDKLPDEPGHH